MNHVATFVDGFHNASDVLKVNYSRLGSTDLQVSRLSLGCAQISQGVEFDSDSVPVRGHEEAEETLIEAIKRGINYLDTSPFYGAGSSELVLGHVLKKVPSFENTIKMVNDSLRKLGVDYIDVIQVHDCEFADSVDDIVKGALPALDQLRSQGKVKYIGVTGYPVCLLKEVVEKSSVKIDTVLSYCRKTLFDDELTHYIPYFKERKLGIINAAVHGMGLLVPCPLPEWHPAPPEIREACTEARQYCSDHGVDICQLALGWALEDVTVDTVLTGMSTRTVLESNWKVLTEGITDHERKVADDLKSDIFSQLHVTNWKGIELDKYKNDRKAFQNYLLKLNNKDPL